MEQMKKDIFISYKNDGSGNQFANRLCQDLESIGYSVYFNSKEERAHSFPERLRTAVKNCRDFLLILSAGCLEQLQRHDTVDWVREEVLCAKENGKHIIPILLEGVDLPKDADDMPEDLRFLPHIDAIRFPEQYVRSPLDVLQGTLKAKKVGSDQYKDTFNSNPDYRVEEDYAALHDAAKSGDTAAMYELGMMCFYGATDQCGKASAWDYDNAAYWLGKVCETENEYKAHALNILARMYYQGTVPREEQSYEKSYQLHAQAAELGNQHSALEQGFMQRVGLGCKFDYDSIVEFYKTKIKNGDDISYLALAKFYSQHGQFDEALKLYDSMSAVSPEAEYQLGVLYRDGVTETPPRPDLFRAAYHFQNAADANHLQAALEYGMLCFRPSGGLRKNMPAAEKYLTFAADRGNDVAQYLLGYLYRTGLLTLDLEKAVCYLEKACEQGYSLAALELAMLYQQPECQNFAKAFECAKLAVSHGTAEAKLILGNLYFWGRGCAADMNKAYEMYRAAASHGLYYANVMMKKIDAIMDAKR